MMLPSRNDVEAYREYLREQQHNDKWLRFDLAVLTVLVLGILGVTLWFRECV